MVNKNSTAATLTIYDAVGRTYGSYKLTGNETGIEKTVPVSIKNGSKTVTVQLKATETKKIRSHGKSADIVGFKTVSFGVPQWATINNVLTFMQDAVGAKSFSIAGGRNHVTAGFPIKIRRISRRL